MKRRLRQRTAEVEAFEQHLLELRGRRGQTRYTPRTARLYANHMNRALAMGSPLAVLRGARTSSLWLQAGNAVLAWARWRGDTALETAVGGIPDPRVPTRETPPPPTDDWAKLLEVVRIRTPEPDRHVLWLVLTSGLRIGDILRLGREQVALIQTNRKLTIGQKGDHARFWRPGAEARAALLALLRVPGWGRVRDLFARPDGQRTEKQLQDAAYNAARKVLGEACAAAGVDFIRLHRYRHGVAEAAHEAGAPLERIQELLGHSDPRTTKDFYLHLGDEEQAALADSVLDKIRRSGR